MSFANEFEWQMLALINAERAAVGADPLRLEITLNLAAENHSDWMIATDMFSHTGVGSSNPGARIEAAGFDTSRGYAWAENIAARTLDATAGYSDEIIGLHQQLMNSPGHRENLLNPAYDFIGIGFEVGEYQGRTWAFVTQKFAVTNGVVNVETVNVENYELQFNSDFNQDGTIGHTLVNLDTTGIGLQDSSRDGYLITDGGETHVLTYQGAAMTPESLAGWEAIQAGSDGAGGYSVLWQHESGTLGVWNVDATGAQYAFADTSNIVDFEDRFVFDLNGDGTIGHTVEDIDTTGIGLQVSTQNGYLITDGGETHVLTYQGAAMTPDSIAGWEAIQAGSDGAGGYSVLWQHESGTLGVWNIDATGAQYAFADTSNMADFEDRFVFDLNGDGTIGHTLEDIDTTGIGLQVSSRDGYLITDGGETHVLTYQGAAMTPDSIAGWEAIQAGSDGAGGYSVLWQHESGTLGVWNVDATGAQYAFADTSNMADFEDRFVFDLNGDGTIGHTVEDIDTTGIGLQVSSRDGYLITDGGETHVLTYQGAAMTPESLAGWEAIQAGSDGAGGYSVLWQHESGTLGVWNIDATGAQYAFPDTSNMADFEDRFMMDLNGDLFIG